MSAPSQALIALVRAKYVSSEQRQVTPQADRIRAQLIQRSIQRTANRKQGMIPYRELIQEVDSIAENDISELIARLKASKGKELAYRKTLDEPLSLQSKHTLLEEFQDRMRSLESVAEKIDVYSEKKQWGDKKIAPIVGPPSRVRASKVINFIKTNDIPLLRMNYGQGLKQVAHKLLNDYKKDIKSINAMPRTTLQEKKAHYKANKDYISYIRNIAEQALDIKGIDKSIREKAREILEQEEIVDPDLTESEEE